MKAIKYLKPLLLGLLVATLLSGCNKRTGLQIGDTAPDVTLTDFQGKTVTLPQDLKGKVAFVHFWGLDCDCCDKKILLSLEPLYQKYKDKGFVPVGINESQFVKTDERLKQFDQLTYPMLVDEYGLVAQHFGVIGLPTTFIIDEEGIVQDKITGEAGIDEYEKRFTTILYKGVFYENGH
jgi:cytochrome c biogenesis protein CcmG/thiol:disulfide interchange protein DsbE